MIPSFCAQHLIFLSSFKKKKISFLIFEISVAISELVFAELLTPKFLPGEFHGQEPGKL